MSESISCPDCGQANDPGLDRCTRCNHPLASAANTHDDTRADAAPGPEPVVPRDPAIARPLRPRPRRTDRTSVSLWILFSLIAAVSVLFIAVKSNMDRASVPVEGSTSAQQDRADELLSRLERDSTDIEARVDLANVYYDTANWSDAAVHYRQAVASDSTQIGAIVDLGVCYYNLGQPRDAEDLFHLALRRDPHHPIALFNLGIVNERFERPAEALGYYHRCLESEPPEEMRQPLLDAMSRLQQQTGRRPGPLPDGRTP